jgi:succinate dehydrogenase / fumarate reductase flavoprotein subunit
MGGIPTNYLAEVVVPKNGNPNSIVPGFYAAGEVGCASIHGANRLGTNSLTDLLVMGKSAGDSMIKFIRENNTHKPLPAGAGDVSMARIAKLDAKTGGESVHAVGDAMRQTMQAHCGVFRFPDMLEKGVTKIKEVAERAEHLEIKDKSKVFNTARIEALELQNLIEVAVATMVSAEARKETRGAHDRADFHDRPGFVNGRDDDNWLKHTLWYKEGNKLDYKPVNLKPLTVDSFAPKARTY